MSSIPQETVQRLLQVLTSLVSTDNSVRSVAETQLNNEWITKTPDALLQGLAHLTRNSDVADVSGTFLIGFLLMTPAGCWTRLSIMTLSATLLCSGVDASRRFQVCSEPSLVSKKHVANIEIQIIRKNPLGHHGGIDQDRC